MGYARYPRSSPGTPSRVTIGGLNLGVSSLLQAPGDAFAASACLRQRRAPEDPRAVKGGCRRPSPRSTTIRRWPRRTRSTQLIKEQLASASVRPQTPLYSDVTLAVQKTLSPPRSINPKSFVSDLHLSSRQALSSSDLI